jgi:CheY-like chemotaxis protein
MPTGQLNGCKILVVDDHDDTRRSLVRVLELFGATTGDAPSGQGALEALQREHFDLLIADLSMPRMNGFQLIQAIRRLPDPGRAQVPVIALSGFDGLEERQRSERAGFALHLSKPTAPPKLVASINQVLRHRAEQADPENSGQTDESSR